MHLPQALPALLCSAPPLLSSLFAPSPIRRVAYYNSNPIYSTMSSRGRSSYYGYGTGGGVGFFGSSSSERLLHPAATRHDVSASADHLADDLNEEDVWSAVTTNDNNHHHRNGDRRPGPACAGGGLSLAFEAASPPARHSAPVSVPEWPAATLPDDGGESSDLEWVPPHEYLQRRWCGGPAAASVLEGAGRTLKGRDITRVRDAVWSKTGFFG